jgi:copper(I)-binding protein
MAGMLIKMRRLAALEIPAGQPVTWKPGGKHITRARYAGGA